MHAVLRARLTRSCRARFETSSRQYSQRPSDCKGRKACKRKRDARSFSESRNEEESLCAQTRGARTMGNFPECSCTEPRVKGERNPPWPAGLGAGCRKPGVEQAAADMSDTRPTGGARQGPTWCVRGMTQEQQTGRRYATPSQRAPHSLPRVACRIRQHHRTSSDPTSRRCSFRIGKLPCIQSRADHRARKGKAGSFRSRSDRVLHGRRRQSLYETVFRSNEIFLWNHIRQDPSCHQFCGIDPGVRAQRDTYRQSIIAGTGNRDGRAGKRRRTSSSVRRAGCASAL